MLTMHVLYRLSYGGSPERSYDNPLRAAVRKEKGAGIQRGKESTCLRSGYCIRLHATARAGGRIESAES